jgi:hypothetical protein
MLSSMFLFHCKEKYWTPLPLFHVKRRGLDSHVLSKEKDWTRMFLFHFERK